MQSPQSTQFNVSKASAHACTLAPGTSQETIMISACRLKSLDVGLAMAH